MRTSSERGFSLLEMIAALTILAIGSVILFSWLGQTMAQLSRFQNDEKSSLAKLQAIQYLSTVSPSLTPKGEKKFDTFKLEWKSEPVSELRESISPSNALGLYQMRLYGVEVAMLDAQGQAWFNFPVRLVGYEQVRQPTPNTPFW